MSKITDFGRMNETYYTKDRDNIPNSFVDRQNQLFAMDTRKFIEETAKYSTDYCDALVQGLVKDNFEEYVSTRIRLSDTTSQTTTTITKDDIKYCLFTDSSVGYIYNGAKIKTMGNVWLVVNAENMSTAIPKALIKRCNAYFNQYDYCGNIVKEPLVCENKTILNDDNAGGGDGNPFVMQGYYIVYCQLNKNTKNLKTNSRLLLGRGNRIKAYHITGITDFKQDFEDSQDFDRLMSIDIRVEEPQEENDDMEKVIANGKKSSFTCKIKGIENISVGATYSLKAIFLRNGEEIASTEEEPLSWEWNTSDENILQVDNNGVITAIDNGTATITATLNENKNIQGKIEVVVNDTQKTEILTKEVIPESLEQYETIFIQVYTLENGVELTTTNYEWSFSGADIGSYYYKQVQNDKIELRCQKSSKNNLTITIKETLTNTEKVLSIKLEGY